MGAPLTVTEIYKLAPEYRIRMTKPESQNTINYYKNDYLESIPIRYSRNHRVAYRLNRKGKRLALRLFGRKR